MELSDLRRITDVTYIIEFSAEIAGNWKFLEIVNMRSII